MKSLAGVAASLAHLVTDEGFRLLMQSQDASGRISNGAPKDLGLACVSTVGPQQDLAGAAASLAHGPNKGLLQQPCVREGKQQGSSTPCWPATTNVTRSGASASPIRACRVATKRKGHSESRKGH